MRIHILTILLLLMGLGASAQSYKTKSTASKKALKYYLKGKELGRANQNDKAIKEFQKALKEEPTFIDAKIEWGAILYSEKDDAGTEVILEEVIAIDPYYNSKLLYTLGVIEERLGKCDEAVPHLQQYLDAPKTRPVIVEKVNKLIAACEFQEGEGAEKVDFKPIRMGDEVNTPNREYFPSISADGNTLYFTRVVRAQEDIYFCQKDRSGEWGEAMPLPGVNTTENEGNQSISADGRYIVFTACNRKDGYGSCDIYFSEFQNDRWTPARNIGPAINTGNWESQPSISADARRLYFTSKRKDGTGKADIYVSYRGSKGDWGKSSLVKGAINTTRDEQTPFIHPDGQTLYFKSNGHPGFGGFDIYYSRLGADGTWGKPVNLGAPINSKADEGSFMVSLDGKTAFFDSNLEVTEEGAGDFSQTLHDIYYFELPESLRPLPVTYVEARVIDAETRQPLVARVDFMDVATNKRHAYSITDNQGEFLVCLPVGKNYGLNVSKEGYLFHSENFALEEEGDMLSPYVLTIELQKIPPEIIATPTKPDPQPTPTKPVESKPIVLRNIFFATGSAELKPESEGELAKLYQLLAETPNMRIRVNGHTDNVGGDADNLALSEKRAAAVRDYLIKKGISASRLESKGYGETHPIASNDTKEGRQLNRRTEFVVLGF